MRRCVRRELRVPAGAGVPVISGGGRPAGSACGALHFGQHRTDERIALAKLACLPPRDDGFPISRRAGAMVVPPLAGIRSAHDYSFVSLPWPGAAGRAGRTPWFRPAKTFACAIRDGGIEDLTEGGCVCSFRGTEGAADRGRGQGRLLRGSRIATQAPRRVSLGLARCALPHRDPHPSQRTKTRGAVVPAGRRVPGSWM